ncbi:MAG TPA: DUF3352 domain-containing protein [Solirubrobacteraceae bacterium]|jgi:hypothetical protein
MPRLLRSAAALAVAATIPVLAACGGGGSSGDASADPAAIVPARAAVYVEANLKPGDDVTELAKKLSGEEDPGGALKRALEKSAHDSNPDFKYSEDVEPWLGDRIGFFVPRVQAGDSPVGLVAPTKDPDKAKKTLENELRRPSKGEPKPQIVERSHGGTKYIVDTSKDDGVAIVDDYAVFGSDEAIKGVIDARKGESLAETSEYDKARDAIEDDGAGFAYVRLSQIFSGLGAQGAAAGQALSGLGDTIAVGLDGDASSLRLESAALGAKGGGAAAGGPGKVFAELPGDAWFAAGASDIGGRIKQAIAQFTQLGALGGQDPEKLLDQLERQLGIDPRRDLANWLGDVGLFVSGETLVDIGGGLIATTKNPAATRRAIPRLARFLGKVGNVRATPERRSGVDVGVKLRAPGLPLPIHMALTDDERFVVAVTDAAFGRALTKGEPLGESKPFTDAAGKLEGFEPAVFLNFPPLAKLLDATGQGSDPSVAKARKALDRLTTLIAGSKRDGDVTRGKLVVGVK